MKIIQLTIASIVLIWCTGFFYFMYITSNISNDDRHATDAIVVFGGKKQNLYVGIQLLKAGYAPVIFITGDKPKEEYDNFLKNEHIAKEQFIFDEHLANSQYNHALDTVLFLQKYQFQSLRVIVSAYQFPRAYKELKANIPSNITLIIHPISQKIKNDVLLLQEYVKYTLFLIASLIGKEYELHLSYSL